MKNDGRLYWDCRGQVVCSVHAPYRGSDTWVFDQWHEISPGLAHKKRLSCEVCSFTPSLSRSGHASARSIIEPPPMTNFNSVVIVGRLTGDPELRYAPIGAPVCSFSVATSRRFTNEAGEKVDSVTVVDIEVWKRLAEICTQFLKKDREVLVMGTLRQTHWVDPKTRESRTKIKVVAQQVQFLGSREDEPKGSSDA